MGTRRRNALAAIVAAVVALSGCSGPVTAPDWNKPVPIHAQAPGKQISLVPGVSYYPACGTELLTYDGTVWYPFTPERPQDFPTPVALSAAGRGPGLSRGAEIALPVVLPMVLIAVVPVAVPARAPVPVVVAPGPGDDVGTLTIFDNGIAYFVSDSGRLSRWLTTEKITYTWAC